MLEEEEVFARRYWARLQHVCDSEFPVDMVTMRHILAIYEKVFRYFNDSDDPDSPNDPLGVLTDLRELQQFFRGLDGLGTEKALKSYDVNWAQALCRRMGAALTGRLNDHLPA